MERVWQGIAGVFRRILRADDPVQTLYHRALPPRLEWNWWALIFGPFWYLVEGLWVHAFILFSIVILSGGVLIPFVWLYAGLKANEDLLDHQVMKRSYY